MWKMGYLDVALVGVEVVVGFLGHGEREDHDKGADVGNEESHPQYFDELGHGVDQEEHVEEELKLVVEHQWHEGEHVVLGVFDQIVLIVDRLHPAVHIDPPPGYLHLL